MPRITVKTRIVYNRLPEISSTVRISLNQGAKGKAEDVIRYMQESMEEPKSGRFYGMHRASAPFEPPAIDSGELYESFYSRGINQYATGVYTTEPDKANWLEYGTIRMVERPFMAPAIAKATNEWPNVVRNIIRQAAK